MGIGIGLLLIAGGAILVWGVNGNIGNVNEDAIGWILMIVGLVGLVLSLAFWSTWWGPGYFRRTVVSHPGGTRRRVVVEQDPADAVIQKRY